MLSRRIIVLATTLLTASSVAVAQADRHGRKYKAPPETSHLEILVLKADNGKVIENAGVIFHPTKDGEDEGNLEVKSGTDGKAFIDIIPTGSLVEVQVIAGGFATYAGKITLDGPSKQLTVRMVRPTQQVSAYDESEGHSTSRKVGVQEPVRNKTLPVTAPKAISGSDPIIKLPALPSKPASDGDATIPTDHNVTPPPQPRAKLPNKTSAPTGPVVDGSPNTSSPSN